MTFRPDDWPRVKALFDAALEVDGAARAPFVASACGDDGDLRRQVETLLAEHQRAGGFLDTPARGGVEPPPDEWIGRTIGTYRVTAKLGAGGMGEVYAAHDTNLDRPVALKLLPAAVAADADRLRRFRAEARAASSLNHPHILVIHDFGDVEGRPFMVTELVEGATLRQRMAGGPVPVREAVDIAVQVASALAAAHARGVLHRDIKPENVMVRPDGYAKVLDFGLAKLLPADPSEAASVLMTNPGTVMGTPRYMSPDQARGLDVDARTDVWSLGVLLYEMLAGRPPFDGATASDVLAAILRAEPAPLDLHAWQAPQILGRLVARTLAKNVDERFPTARELHADLAALKTELDSGAGRTPAPRPTTAVRESSGLIDSLAVLPFANASGDPDTEYLSDGITESLINEPYCVALVHAGLAEPDRALEWLEAAYREYSAYFTLWAKVDPRLDVLRGDSRFQDLLRRAGLGDVSPMAL